MARKASQVIVREPDLAEAKKAFEKTQKRRGLRHPNLRARLGYDLGALWGVTPDDSPEEVQEKASTSLDLAINQRLPEPFTYVARDYYNISADTRLWQLDLGARLRVIYAKYGEKHSPRDVHRKVQEHLPALLAHLGELAAVWSASEVTSVGAGLYDVGRDLHDHTRIRDRIVDKFHREILYVPSSSDTGFRVTRIPDFGDWLPAFLSPTALARYGIAARVPQPWLPRRLLGSALLRELRERGMRVGILIDPEPAVTENLHHTTVFDPDTVEMMTDLL